MFVFISHLEVPSADDGELERHPSAVNPPESLTAALTRWFLGRWRLLLVLSAFPLFLVGASYHVPLGLMVLLGLGVLMGTPSALLRSDPTVRLILLVFLALWIPQLISLPGAAAPITSLRAAGRYLLYPVAALYIARVLQTAAANFERLALGIGAVITFWSLDHLLGPAGLNVTSKDVPGYPGGIVFDEHTLAHVAAAASPLVFELIHRRHRADPRIWLLLAPILLLVLISGRRVAWMMLGVAAAGYLLPYVRKVRRTPALAGAAIVVAGISLLVTQHDVTRERLDMTLGLLSGDREVVDFATSNRLDIWTTAANTARASWPLGVGTLGSRYVYAENAEPGDFWVSVGQPWQHPHLFVLEVAAENGLAGLIGYVVVLIALGFALAHGLTGWGWASGIALLVAIFPLNAHASFYGSHWSMVLWWFVGLTAAGLVAPPDAAPAVMAEAPQRVGSVDPAARRDLPSDPTSSFR